MKRVVFKEVQVGKVTRDEWHNGDGSASRGRGGRRCGAFLFAFMTRQRHRHRVASSADFETWVMSASEFGLIPSDYYFNQAIRNIHK